MKKVSILWTDDEIDLLNAHIIFLEAKGFELSTASNGDDAIEMVKKHDFDLIFLDENMPGLSGLQTLTFIKEIKPDIPVIMITKSEEEDIMEQAIGSKIADYLIKPVNPKQILLSIKKNIDTKRLISEKAMSDYQSEFGKIGLKISDVNSFNGWVELYKKLVYWELELEQNEQTGMQEVFQMQKSDANKEFAKFIKNNYESWFADSEDKPMMSPNLFKERIFPMLDKGEKVFVLVIDNFRYDQWKLIQPLINEYFTVESEELYCSILPTATQYARNAIFAGLMPYEIDKLYPEYWLNDEEDGGKNMKEEELLQTQLSRHGKSYKFFYEKISQLKTGEKLVENIKDLLNNQLNVLVYNYIDMLSHARTEIEMIRELANDEPAYRSLTLSWFKHSPLFTLIKELKSHDVKIIITTDHGTVRVKNPVKVIGDKNTSTNLRYKNGRNLNYNPKEVFEIRDPQKVHLPKSHLSTSYIFAINDDFLAYPNNFNYYVSYYKDTFQHGGVSLEEMIIPFVKLKPNN
ncbi:MAG TPA: two-component system response regulator [Bacteroidales bacterium]|nr:two-component system response regulator [Bacteroidales bacterium]